MAWWIWILLGFGFLVAEVVTPGGFFAFFFGISAIIVGLLAWFSLAGPEWMQWLLFSILCVTTLLYVRPHVAVRFAGSAGGNTPLPEFIGDTAVLLEDLEPGSVAKAELRGTSWTARSRHPARLPRGSRCTVQRVEGLTLWIEPQQGES